MGLNIELKWKDTCETHHALNMTLGATKYIVKGGVGEKAKPAYRKFSTVMLGCT